MRQAPPHTDRRAYRGPSAAIRSGGARYVAAGSACFDFYDENPPATWTWGSSCPPAAWPRKDFTRISDQAINEALEITGARMDSTNPLLDQARRTLPADAAATDALSWQPGDDEPTERGECAVTASVVVLHPDASAAADRAFSVTSRHLDRCKLAENTVVAYRRQAAAYVAWLAQHVVDHPDAFADLVGAEAAVTAWRRHLLRTAKASPRTVNQALAAATLLYERGARLRIQVKRARVPRPGEPDALTIKQQSRLERAADRRGPRDTAIIAVLLYAGDRAEEASRLELEDIAITARTGELRIHGKGDEVRTVPLPAQVRDRISAWLRQRGHEPGPMWTGQRGRLTTSGLTQVVLAVGEDAGIDGLRPHQLRHTYATRLRQGGADVAQIQALLGHASLDTSARYIRAGTAEKAAVVEAIFNR